LNEPYAECDKGSGQDVSTHSRKRKTKLIKIEEPGRQFHSLQNESKANK